MATKGTKVSKREIARMVMLYEELGTYTAVGKKMRRSPDTVAKYVQMFYIAQQQMQTNITINAANQHRFPF